MKTKFPRTMEEAFGPYHRGGISEPYSKMDITDKIITGICGIIMFVLLLAIIAGVI